MNTRLILTSSAIFMAVLGLFLTFFPNEIGDYMSLGSSALSAIVLQLLGALYLGFAMINWMAKGARIGGIYNRPVALGNFMHFLIGAITLLKYSFSVEEHRWIVWGIAVLYTLFGILFSIIFRRNPEG